MSKGIIRDKDGDLAGGIIGTPKQTICKVEGFNVAIKGESIASHGTHSNATMNESSRVTFINKIAICFSGNKATCGHSASPGSLIVFSD